MRPIAATGFQEKFAALAQVAAVWQIAAIIYGFFKKPEGKTHGNKTKKTMIAKSLG
jgi:hypothetical protein